MVCLVETLKLIGNLVFLCSNQNVPAVVEGGYLDNSQSLTRALAKLQTSEVHVTSTDSKGEQPKQETQFLPEGPQSQAVITVPNYSLGVIPTMVGNQIVPYEGVENQAHESRIPIFAVSSLTPSLSSVVSF